MWDQVLENHGKYNEFIYAHTDDKLYVNLFIPSELNWKEKDLTVIQENDFPQEASTRLTFNTEKPQKLNLLLRYPDWVTKGKLKVLVNGKEVSIKEEPGSYLSVEGLWKNGDTVEMKLPMHITVEALPDGSDYRALKYGPIVLGAKTNAEDMKGLFADASRGGHIADGKKIPLSETPIFLTERPNNIAKDVHKEANSELRFSAADILYPAKFKNLEFIPFYKIHDSRYVIYLPVETPESLAAIQKKRKEEEIRERKLEALTIDKVAPGEQQPESDHFIKSENSNIGVNQDRHWRDASGWFSYVLKDENKEAAKLRVTYFGEDRDRNFNIYVNGQLLAEEYLKGDKGDTFFSKDYMLPQKLLKKKPQELTIKFEAMEGSRTAGVYGIRLMKTE